MSSASSVDGAAKGKHLQFVRLNDFLCISTYHVGHVSNKVCLLFFFGNSTTWCASFFSKSPCSYTTTCIPLSLSFQQDPRSLHMDHTCHASLSLGMTVFSVESRTNQICLCFALSTICYLIAWHFGICKGDKLAHFGEQGYAILYFSHFLAHGDCALCPISRFDDTMVPTSG